MTTSGGPHKPICSRWKASKGHLEASSSQQGLHALGCWQAKRNVQCGSSPARPAPVPHRDLLLQHSKWEGSCVTEQSQEVPGLAQLAQACPVVIFIV